MLSTWTFLRMIWINLFGCLFECVSRWRLHFCCLYNARYDSNLTTSKIDRNSGISLLLIPFTELCYSSRSAYVDYAVGVVVAVPLILICVRLFHSIFLTRLIPSTIASLGIHPKQTRKNPGSAACAL